MTPTQVVDSIYEAFKRGDVNHIVSLVSPDAEWRQSASLPWGGDFRGPQGAAEFFSRLNATMETTGFEVRENVEKGLDVFSFGRYEGRSRKTGIAAGADWMFRWRVENGKIVSYNSYIDTAALLATGISREDARATAKA